MKKIAKLSDINELTTFKFVTTYISNGKVRCECICKPTNVYWEDKWDKTYLCWSTDDGDSEVEYNDPEELINKLRETNGEYDITVYYLD